MVEQGFCKPQVVSSILTVGTKFRSSQLRRDKRSGCPDCQFIRSVAQSGRALRLGRKGPRFESVYSDQFYSLIAQR